MRLLFILSEYLPDSGGGIITYYKEVLPHLAKSGVDVHVLIANTDTLNRTERSIDGVNIQYLNEEFLTIYQRQFERYRHGFPSFYAFLPVAWAAYKQSKGGEEFDLVEVTDFPMLYAPWISENLQRPVNISLHGSPGQIDWHENPGNGGIDADFLRLVEQVAFSSAGSIQANSKTNAIFWEELTNRSVQVLPPAFRLQEPCHKSTSAQQGGLVVGRLQNWKGPRILCEAIRSIPTLNMTWIGRDVTDPLTGKVFSENLKREFPDIFQTRLRHENQITNTEARSRIADADFLCVPSTWDVFNLTAVEAMELGTPVVCSTKAGASMLIEHGINGFLFDPDCPNQLVDAIKEIQSLEQSARKRLTENARNTIRSHLSPEKLAAERIKYYQTLINSFTAPSPSPWLSAALQPSIRSHEKTKQLGSYTTGELTKAAFLQVRRGLSRRLRQWSGQS